ncbi:MAG: rod-binding protein [Candidatus Brocadiales bacterium]
MNISFDPSILTGEQTIAKLKDLSQADKTTRSQHELKKAANDFEAILTGLLIKAMWKTIPDSGLYEKSSSKDVYTDIMLSALSDEITKLGGFGVAQTLYEEMKKSLVLSPPETDRDKLLSKVKEE